MGKNKVYGRNKLPLCSLGICGFGCVLRWSSIVYYYYRDSISTIPGLTWGKAGMVEPDWEISE